jgi:hypothetical protein
MMAVGKIGIKEYMDQIRETPKLMLFKESFGFTLNVDVRHAIRLISYYKRPSNRITH